MADDLYIKPAGAGTTQNNNGDLNLPPVIDLRVLDQGAQTNGANAGAAPQNSQTATQGTASNQSASTSTTANNSNNAGTTSSQNTVAAANASQINQFQPVKKNVISLEEEANQYVVANNQKYIIPTMVREKFPDLIQLIQETESMSDDEREYWFQILPIMTETQIQKFRTILINEKEQLARLDKEYEEELKKLNDKHMLEWKAFETKEQRKALQQAEAASDAAEQSLEEELLQKLSQM